MAFNNAKIARMMSPMLCRVDKKRRRLISMIKGIWNGEDTWEIDRTRTVFVKNNNVDDACRLLNRILGKEGILEQFRLTRYYEKPFQTRRRVNHERCKAIFNEDMERKIQFVLRKNRHEPFPGCH